MGFSGDFSRVGRRVFSAQSFSLGDGRRPSNTSAIGFSATCGLGGFLSGMWNLTVLDACLSRIIEEGGAWGKVRTYWQRTFHRGSGSDAGTLVVTVRRIEARIWAWSLLKADAAHQVLETRVGAERVKPQICLKEVRNIWRFFLKGLLQKF